MNSDTQPAEIYGYSFLDDLHTLFPELLYDNYLFPNNDSNRLLNWVRHRMTYLFPQSFRRARTEYERLYAQDRRNDYDDWAFIYRNDPRTVRAPVQMVMRDYPGFETRNTIFPNHTLQTPARRTGASIAPNSATPPTSGGDAVRALLGLLNQYDSPQNSLLWNSNIHRIPNPITISGSRSPTLDWLELFLSSVEPVRPSAADIQTNTELLQETSISGEIICAICQDHESEGVAVEWRRLRSCQHIFHKNCIDRWFTTNPHCPVCRADIRNPLTQHTMSDSTASDSVNYTSPSNLRQ